VRSIPILRSLFARGSPLLVISGLEVGFPFVRMLALSHFLDVRELGFASLLAATYSTFEQVTDIAMYRFVLSAPREVFAEALASAHALSALRGLVVGALAVAAAPLLASGFGVGTDWPSFAVLGPLTVIHSLEHIGPRIAERDYRYDVQLRIALIGCAAGFLALGAAIALRPDHNALVASLFGTISGQTIASHALAGTPYRLRIRSPEFRKAFRFGYPLMFNGVGLAISAQGDRLLVGAMLGLPALGVYSVLLLVSVVPISPIVRVTGSVTVAMLVNASNSSQALTARLSCMARLTPAVATLYSAGIIALMNIVVPPVFGAKFTASRWTLVLLAAAAFTRIVRSEPGTSVLLYQARTKRLALANVLATSGLLFAFLLMMLIPSIETAVLGRLAGEFLGLAAMIVLSRKAFGSALVDFFVSVGLGFALLAAMTPMTFALGVGERISPSIAMLIVVLGLCGSWIWRPISRLPFGDYFRPTEDKQ
jgi:O-antigen/teichoic acid export membrane protein